MKTFDIKTRWGTTTDCVLSSGAYRNNNHVALSIFSLEDGPFANITVNVDRIEKYPKNFSCIDVNNFPEAGRVIADLGIGKPTDDVLFSGMCVYPVYEFDMEAIAEWCKEDTDHEENS